MRLNRSVLTLSTALVLVCGSLVAMQKQPPGSASPAVPVTAKQPEAKQPIKVDPKAPKQYEGPDGTLYSVVNTTTLTMEDLKIGTGAEVTTESTTITAHCKGSLASNGKVFYATPAKETATLPIERLIPGLRAGITGMKVGGVRRFAIPWHLAYGEPGSHAGTEMIPPRADLVFSVELTAVK